MLRAAALLVTLCALVLSAFGCASTPPTTPAPASMSITPQPCVADQLQYPDPCAQPGPGYYDSAPYTYYPILVAPFYPGVLPAPTPVIKPPAPPPPPSKPPVKTGGPKLRDRPCPRTDRPCP